MHTKQCCQHTRNNVNHRHVRCLRCLVSISFFRRPFHALTIPKRKSVQANKLIITYVPIKFFSGDLWNKKVDSGEICERFLSYLKYYEAIW